MEKIDRKRSLTREKVLKAAVQLIDQEGLENFSMRKLGLALGVEAMSLYNHIANKEELFDGVIEFLLLQIPFPETSNSSPYDDLWVFAHDFRNVLRAHPRALPLFASRPLRTPASLSILERLLATLHRANIYGAHAIYVLNGMVGFIIGHELLDVGSVLFSGMKPEGSHSKLWQDIPGNKYPVLHNLMSDLENGNPDQQFSFGLQALLAFSFPPKNITREI
ncbi:TetR/AcrR family transcriptional regulator [Paenibacillus sp. OAE614]|uniref:TetR/AcrR family transcriptional regulator n=1 Tax=Paenibacillus sp. OAE614 TaxID=2663804 RepID=UPI001789FEB6